MAKLNKAFFKQLLITLLQIVTAALAGDATNVTGFIGL